MHASFKICAVIGLSLIVSGCDMYQEGNLTPNRVQLEEQQYAQETPTSDVDKDYIASMANYYHRHGDGPANVTVTFDPRSGSNSAMKASTEMARISKTLKDHGVTNVNGSILPVNGQGEESQTLITFDSYNALAPKDCGIMEGVESTDITLSRDYKLGCTVDTLFARQVARPKDLAGQQQSDPYTDGRRGANIVDGYRTGTPNEPLQGQEASE